MRIKLTFIILFISSTLITLSCRSRMTSAERQAYQYEKQMKKENEKLVEEYLEHHYNIQALETQEMMKASGKRAIRANNHRKDSWVERTFKRKRSKSCDGN